MIGPCELRPRRAVTVELLDGKAEIWVEDGVLVVVFVRPISVVCSKGIVVRFICVHDFDVVHLS